VNRRSWTGTFAVLIATSMYLLPAPEAQAFDNNGACEADEVCVWRDADFTGCFWDWNQEASVDNLNDLKYDTCPGQKMGDSITSYRNNLKNYIMIFGEHPKFKGYLYCVGERASGNILPGFNDKASSMAATETLTTQDVNCNHIDRD
jgi:hypothetical protein